jgi:hypothetical protein
MLSRNRIVRVVSVLISAAFFSVVLAPGAHASALNEKTRVTIKGGPVQLAGRVLEPGTYTFKLLGQATGADVVAVNNTNTHQFISFILASPVWRSAIPNHAIVTLSEEPSNAPPAIHEWFYPGDQFGLAFNYRHARPAQQG